MTVHPEQEHEEPQRKGRGNAILTYEVIHGIDRKLTELSGKMDRYSEKMEERVIEHNDHEVRIRVMETSITAMQAARTQSTSTWMWVYPSLFSAASLILALIMLFRSMGK